MIITTVLLNVDGDYNPTARIWLERYSLCEIFGIWSRRPGGHSQKKEGSRDPGSHDFFGQNSEKYFEKFGKILGKIRKNTSVLVPMAVEEYQNHLISNLTT